MADYNRRPRAAHDIAHDTAHDFNDAPDRHDMPGPDRSSTSTPRPSARRAHPYERDLREAFGFSAPRNYPYAGVASEERRGRFFGRGPKGYRRSDERIREEISDRFMTHPDLDASDIDVVVANGTVTLTGTVEDRHEKRLADLIAEDALGVDDVQNRLRVRHGFWATVSGERAMERQFPGGADRDDSSA